MYLVTRWHACFPVGLAKEALFADNDMQHCLRWPREQQWRPLRKHLPFTAEVMTNGPKELLLLREVTWSYIKKWLQGHLK